MAKYYGYVNVAHSTYNEWRNTTNGNGYDVDGYYGCQCYDLALLFWWNVGFPQGYPVSGIPGQGNTGNAYDIWTYRAYNTSYNGTTYFDIITNLSDVKRGDVIVFNQFPGNTFGHVGFADVDYNSWTPDPNQPYEFPILSENNQGTPDPAGGSYANIHGYDIRLFLGAFRYRLWEVTPPVPPAQVTSKFKWVLYANKLRSRNQL